MKQIAARLQVAKNMPPLKHKTGEEFDPKDSEVVRWLIQQPEILNYLFDAVRGNKYREPAIIYDPETKTWQGIDYDPEKGA